MMLNVSHAEYRGQIKVVFLGELPNLDPCTSRYGSRMVQKSNVSDLALHIHFEVSICPSTICGARARKCGYCYLLHNNIEHTQWHCDQFRHGINHGPHSQIYCRSMSMTTVVPNMSSHARQRYYRFWKTVLQIELTFYCPSLSLAKKEQSGFSFPKVPILHFLQH